MAVVVTHTKTLAAPDSGAEDKVYGTDYVSATSHAVAGLGTLATQDGTFSGTSSGTNTGDQTLAGLGGVATTRNINTTVPVTGGGDLSVDRTIAVSNFVASGPGSARGTVPDPGVVAGTTKYLREDATWQTPSATVAFSFDGGSNPNMLFDAGVTNNDSFDGGAP